MYNDDWWRLFKIGIQFKDGITLKQKYIHFYFSTKRFITSSWAVKDYNKQNFNIKLHDILHASTFTIDSLFFHSSRIFACYEV